VVLEGEDVSASSDATVHALMVGAAKTIMDYICLSVREIWDCFGGERKHGVKRGFTRLRKRREESDVSFGAIQWINQTVGG
jgi:hypothetical protein